jgi:hypothetical protein
VTHKAGLVSIALNNIAGCQQRKPESSLGLGMAAAHLEPYCRGFLPQSSETRCQQSCQLLRYFNQDFGVLFSTKQPITLDPIFRSRLQLSHPTAYNRRCLIQLLTTEALASNLPRLQLSHPAFRTSTLSSNFLPLLASPRVKSPTMSLLKRETTSMRLSHALHCAR